MDELLKLSDEELLKAVKAQDPDNSLLYFEKFKMLEEKMGIEPKTAVRKIGGLAGWTCQEINRIYQRYQRYLKKIKL